MILGFEHPDHQGRTSIDIAVNPTTMESGNSSAKRSRAAFQQSREFVELSWLGREAVDENERPQRTAV
jgi:hypothetical protein